MKSMKSGRNSCPWFALEPGLLRWGGRWRWTVGSENRLRRVQHIEQFRGLGFIKPGEECGGAPFQFAGVGV